jgi:hypothetical protein
MTASQDRRAFWRAHEVDRETGNVMERTPAPFTPRPTHRRRSTLTNRTPSKAPVRRARKLALASKRRNRA